MVKSNIRSEIDYSISKNMDPADIGYESSIYTFTLYGEEVDIAVGKPKYEYTSKYGIVYFPIYLVMEEEPVCCIGIYEIESNDVLHSFQQGDGEQDEEMELKSNHILITISKAYFSSIFKKWNKEHPTKPPANEQEQPLLEAPEIEESEEPEDEQHLKLPPMAKEPSPKESSKRAPLKSTLFEDTQEDNLKNREPLPEESQDDAALLKREFKESTRNQWIEKFMKNNEYHIVDNEGGGDCFFAVIRDAFASIGKKTTVQKLRDLLAEEATPQLFEESRSLYMGFLGELQEKEKELKEMKKTSALLKKRAQEAETKATSEAVLMEAKQVVEKHKNAMHEKHETQSLLNEFSYMKTIDSFEKYKEFLKTSQYWADTWAVSTLEKLLKIKVVILSQESFESGDFDSVLQCGQLNDIELEKTGSFRPDYYIMTSYTGNHYTLITYKNRRIFTFREIPYDIKVLVINKCMERNAGPYYLLQDFRTLKTKFGLEANHGEPDEDEEEKEAEWIKKDLCEKNVVFMFHENSAKSKAGKGSGEELAKKRLLEFNALNQITDWRKQLDDSWISPFSIDGKRWSSVEHYFLAAQYKKGFPDFFAQFSLDSKSDMSKEVVMARAAVSKSGKYKDKVLRDRKVTPDADFFEIKVEPRYKQERRIALYAKFSQNLDLKHTLLETQRARLVHFVRSRDPEVDIQLMELRKEFQLPDKK